MKVQEQIKWEEKLWVMSSWGSKADRNSGVYSYICNFTIFRLKDFHIQKHLMEYVLMLLRV